MVCTRFCVAGYASGTATCYTIANRAVEMLLGAAHVVVIDECGANSPASMGPAATNLTQQPQPPSTSSPLPPPRSASMLPATRLNRPPHLHSATGQRSTSRGPNMQFGAILRSPDAAAAQRQHIMSGGYDGRPARCARAQTCGGASGQRVASQRAEMSRSAGFRRGRQGPSGAPAARDEAARRAACGR